LEGNTSAALQYYSKAATLSHPLEDSDDDAYVDNDATMEQKDIVVSSPAAASCFCPNCEWPLMVAVAGATRSGKTTLARTLMKSELFTEHFIPCALLSQDKFFDVSFPPTPF
jgi:RNase P subunit RPR2